MSNYIPKIGDVIKDNGMPFVVIAMKNYETTGSMSYNRRYLLCEEKFLNEHQGNVDVGTLERHGRWVTIRGTEFPDIEKADIVPYVIQPLEGYFIRQKQAKVVTIYE